MRNGAVYLGEVKLMRHVKFMRWRRRLELVSGQPARCKTSTVPWSDAMEGATSRIEF